MAKNRTYAIAVGGIGCYLIASGFNLIANSQETTDSYGAVYVGSAFIVLALISLLLESKIETTKITIMVLEIILGLPCLISGLILVFENKSNETVSFGVICLIVASKPLQYWVINNLIILKQKLFTALKTKIMRQL